MRKTSPEIRERLLSTLWVMQNTHIEAIFCAKLFYGLQVFRRQFSVGSWGKVSPCLCWAEALGIGGVVSKKGSRGVRRCWKAVGGNLKEVLWVISPVHFHSYLVQPLQLPFLKFIQLYLAEEQLENTVRPASAGTGPGPIETKRRG